MNIDDFRAAVTGGDLPADAVREGRCLKGTFGCGQQIANGELARQYWTEWRISGLCADCQDRLYDAGRAE
jgi:hypothetical protein